MDLRDAILGADDCKAVPVEVPEWGRTLYVRPLTALELLAFEEWVSASKPTNAHILARLVVLTVHDDAGAAIFRPGDEDPLMQKAGLPLTRLGREAVRLNGLTQQQQDALLGNSANGRSVASPTA